MIAGVLNQWWVKPGEGVRCDWKGSRIGRSVTLPPPPGRRDSRRNSNTGEGGVGALEASGTWRPDRWPPGRCSRSGDSGGHGRSGDCGGLGGSGSSGDHGGTGDLALIFSGGSGSSVALALRPATQAEVIGPPPPNFLGEVPLCWALRRSVFCGAHGKR